MKINILAITAHPDDVELSCGGTLLVHKSRGFTTGIIDLTRGEMGTRGSAEERDQEARDSAAILDLDVRDNLEFEDSFFTNDREHQLAVVRKLRQYQPDIVLTNALYDRHPDHARGAALVEEAFFKAGLRKLVTQDSEGNDQAPWRPKKLYFAIQSTSLTPDFFVDISDVQEKKMDSVRAFKTQFYDPKSKEPQTYISNPDFMQMIEARSREYGHRIGCKHAEGFMTRQALGVKDLYHLT